MFKTLFPLEGLSSSWNAIGRSNGSILECTGPLKNVVNDFNFNVSVTQIMNN